MTASTGTIPRKEAKEFACRRAASRGRLERWLRSPKHQASPLQDRLEIGFDTSQRCVNEFATRDHDHVDPTNNLVAPVQVTHPPFCPVPTDGRPNLPRRRNTEPRHTCRVRTNEHGHERTRKPRPVLVDSLIVFPAPHTFSKREPLACRQLGVSRLPSWRRDCRIRGTVGQGGRPARAQDVDTVRRLRPFARRRLMTSRPFLVAMRTRNPWVRLR